MPRIKAASLEEHHEFVWGEITVALRELLTERDYDTITFGHIAERAGIARNSLYRYAPDKTALMLAIAHREGGPVVERVAAIAAEQVDAIERVCRIIDELVCSFDSSTTSLMLQPSLARSIPSEAIQGPQGPFSEIATAMESVIRDGVREGTFSLAADEQVTAWLLSGILRSAAETMMRDRRSPADLVPTVQHLVVGALTRTCAT